jgi:hypothetical protein
MGSKRSLSDAERILKENGALPDLQALARFGCNREGLISVLEIAGLADDSWTTRLGRGMDRRKFLSIMEQIRECANLIARLNRSELIHTLSVELRDPWFAALHNRPTLPERLRYYAQSFELLPKVFGPRRRNREDSWKALLVAQVLEDTGRPHDKQVSALIAAVLDLRKYSEQAHGKWRRNHGAQIKKMEKHLANHSKLLPEPPSA